MKRIQSSPWLTKYVPTVDTHTQLLHVLLCVHVFLCILELTDTHFKSSECTKWEWNHYYFLLSYFSPFKFTCAFSQPKLHRALQLLPPIGSWAEVNVSHQKQITSWHESCNVFVTSEIILEVAGWIIYSDTFGPSECPSYNEKVIFSLGSPVHLDRSKRKEGRRSEANVKSKFIIWLSIHVNAFFLSSSHF